MKFINSLMATIMFFKSGFTNTMNPKDFYDDAKEIRLLKAVRRGNTNEIKRLVQDHNVNVNAQGHEGMRPIFWAMGNESKEGLRTLLELGADPNVQAPGLGAPLHLAAVATDSEYLKILLEHNANPNIKNNAGDPVTAPIIRQRRWENLKLWLDHGGDINITNAANETPIRHAAVLNQYEQVAYLIERGADFRIPARSGGTVAHIIHTRRVSSKLPAYQWQQKVREMLIERGVEFPPPTPREIRKQWEK